MYLADTRRGLISHAFDFDVARGTLGERRVFADLGAMPGGPDGATVDAEGYLWSAQVDGGCLIRYAPDGRIDRVVRAAGDASRRRARSAATGYRKLFVTTATRGMTRRRPAAPSRWPAACWCSTSAWRAGRRRAVRRSCGRQERHGAA